MFRRLASLSTVPRLALASLFLAACGGSSSGPGAKSAANARCRRQPNTAPDISIGDTALANGGLDALGGGKNRSNAQIAASNTSSLRFDRLDKDSPVKMDGSLREWPARTAAKKVVKGDASKTAFAVALQYDDAHVYVGGDVGDSGFVRSSRFADTEDHAVLTIAFPVGSGALAAYDVALFAGEPGESAGVVRFASGGRRGQEVPGAKIVEAPAAGGYTFEASIPWSAFPEGHTTRVGLRGNVRYVDSDGPNAVRAVIASGDGDAAHASTLPSLLTEPEQAIVEGLLVPKGLLGATPRFDLVADVAGDAMKERITVYDRFVTICGPHYRNGSQFFFRDVGGEVVSLDAREITGRAKQDLVVQRKSQLGGATRQSFEVWSILGKTDEPQTTFGHEIAIVSGASHVDNTVHVSGHDIEVATEPAVGWDVASYAEPYATDFEPVLLPWGAVKSQVFRFDGAKFAKVKEVAQQPAPGAPPRARRVPPGHVRQRPRRSPRPGARDPRRRQGEGPRDGRLRPLPPGPRRLCEREAARRPPGQRRQRRAPRASRAHRAGHRRPRAGVQERRRLRIAHALAVRERRRREGRERARSHRRRRGRPGREGGATDQRRGVARAGRDRVDLHL